MGPCGPNGTGTSCASARRPHRPRVQLVHASAAILSLGRLEVYLNQPATSTTPDAVVGFQGATAFLKVPADAPLQVRVRPVVAPPAPAPREYALTSVPLAGSTRYVVNLAGIPDELLALYAPHPTGLSQAFALIAREFEALLTRSLGSGVPVVVTHAVTDAPALDVVVAGTGQVLADELPYGQAVTATLAPGTYRIEVRNAATGALLTAVRFVLDGTEGAFPLAITGFLNPAANRNGPALALTATDAMGATDTGVVVTGADDATANGLALDVVNPVRGSALVRYGLAEAGPVRLAVVDALGREVAVLADGSAAAGTHGARLGGSGAGRVRAAADGRCGVAEPDGHGRALRPRANARRVWQDRRRPRPVVGARLPVAPRPRVSWASGRARWGVGNETRGDAPLWRRRSSGRVGWKRCSRCPSVPGAKLA